MSLTCVAVDPKQHPVQWVRYDWRVAMVMVAMAVTMLTILTGGRVQR